MSGTTAAWLLWGRRVGLAAATALLLTYLPYRVWSQASDEKLLEMRSELDRTRSQIAELRRENAERRRRVEALRDDPRTIESIARQDLQMLYPHEKTLRLEKESP